MRLATIVGIVPLLVAVIAPGCRNTSPPPAGDVALSAFGATGRSWATELHEPGLPNLHKVSDNLYRGAQPSEAGLRRLQDMGIKTVVNLRTSDDDGEALRGTPMGYVRIPMSAWNLRDADVIRFLQVVSDPAQMPVFVHCEHGADRTGVLCAMYRIAVEDWTPDDAAAEMTRNGMGFNSLFGNLVERVRTADAASLRRQAGLLEQPSVARAD